LSASGHSDAENDRLSLRLKKLPDFLELICGKGSYAAAQRLSSTTMKAVKLLYFADREHLVKYGRPILGDGR
jgi:hypothetical protein